MNNYWSCEVALSWTATRELDLDIARGELQSLEANEVTRLKAEDGPTGGTPSMIAPTEAQWLSP